jgi:hypothetical protein
MIIDLYQDDKECFFWTKEELSFIEESQPNTFKLTSSNPDIVSFKGNTLRIFRKNRYNLINGIFEPDSDIILIVLFFGTLTYEDFRKFISNIKNNPEKKFVIVGKNVEDYWICMENRVSDNLLKEIGGLDNVSVIWDVAGVNYKNFYFEPKVTFHNYYNNPTFFGYMFINGSELFHRLSKEHRIGIHINKITDKARIWLFKTYSVNNHSNLFFTSRKHINDNIFSNEISADINGVTNNWYFDQFIELTTKSQMEIVYETFTTTAEHNWLLKWNEKTIKLLFLAKPFIHLDPSAHSLFKPNGLKPYRSLYTDELWNMYEEYDNQKLLLINRSESNIWWREALERNIEWLLNMDMIEWKRRIKEANDTAKENRRIIDGYLFNQSLFSYV